MILKNKTFFLLVLSSAAIASPAFATQTVTSPYVTKGKAEIEWRGGYEDMEDGDDVWKTRNQISYGFTDFYDLKVSLDTRHSDGEDEFTDIDFENKFQLTPRGEYFVDLGVRLDYTLALDGGADGIGAEILLGKQAGAYKNLANLEVEREVGEDSSDDWGYGLSYAVSREVNEQIALGLEWYSDFGDFEDGWDEQSHQAGPVIYGAAPLGLEYEAGIFAGLSDGAPDAEAKLVISYEF